MSGSARDGILASSIGQGGTSMGRTTASCSVIVVVGCRGCGWCHGMGSLVFVVVLAAAAAGLVIFAGACTRLTPSSSRRFVFISTPRRSRRGSYTGFIRFFFFGLGFLLAATIMAPFAPLGFLFVAGRKAFHRVLVFAR